MTAWGFAARCFGLAILVGSIALGLWMVTGDASLPFAFLVGVSMLPLINAIFQGGKR